MLTLHAHSKCHVRSCDRFVNLGDQPGPVLLTAYGCHSPGRELRWDDFHAQPRQAEAAARFSAQLDANRDHRPATVAIVECEVIIRPVRVVREVTCEPMSDEQWDAFDAQLDAENRASIRSLADFVE